MPCDQPHWSNEYNLIGLAHNPKPAAHLDLPSLYLPTVQVALLSGLDAEGLKKLNSTKDGETHLNKLLRVLTVRTESGRDRSGIALVGGPHDPKADGSATQRYPSA